MYGNGKPCCSGQTSRLRRGLSGYTYPVGGRSQLSGVRDVIRDAAIAAAGSGAAQMLSGARRSAAPGLGFPWAAIASTAYKGYQAVSGGGGGRGFDGPTRCPGMPPPEAIARMWKNMPPDRRQYHLVRFRANNSGHGPDDEQHLWSGAYGGRDCINKGDPAWLQEIKEDEKRYGGTAGGNGAAAQSLPARAGAAAKGAGSLIPWLLAGGLAFAVFRS